REGIEAWMKTRAAFLEHGIRELLHDKKAEGLAKSFYSHPLIYSLFSNEYKPGNESKNPGAWTSGAHLPSYIPAKNFALTLMDIAVRGPATDVVSSDPNSPKVTVDSIRMNIGNIGNPAVQRVLLKVNYCRSRKISWIGTTVEWIGCQDIINVLLYGLFFELDLLRPSH